MATVTYISIDTETGGLFPESHPLLQVGIGVYTLDETTMLDTTLLEVEWNLKPSQFPGKTLDPNAMAVNHLNPEELEANGLDVAEVSAQIVDIVKKHKNAVILGQNLPFDLNFIRSYLTPEAWAAIDSLRRKDLLDVSLDYNLLTWTDDGRMPSRSLGKMAARLNVINPDAHRALADAVTTFKAMVAMFKRFREANRIIQLVRNTQLNINEMTMLSRDIT
jgi:DNA polymerase III epsilon subunit-like protein